MGLLPCKKWKDKTLSKEQVAPQDVPKPLNPWHPQEGTAIRRPDGQKIIRTKWLQGPRIIDETSISVTLSLYQTMGSIETRHPNPRTRTQEFKLLLLIKLSHSSSGLTTADHRGGPAARPRHLRRPEEKSSASVTN